MSVQVSRGLLPDTGSEYEGDGGNISDALEFLLLNFTEMNKLWVRMQHQGSGKDRCAEVLHARILHNAMADVLQGALSGACRFRSAGNARRANGSSWLTWSARI